MTEEWPHEYQELGWGRCGRPVYRRALRGFTYCELPRSAGIHRMSLRRKVGRRCQDCGWERPVRLIAFSATGYRYVVCAACERAYRAMSRPVPGSGGGMVAA